VGISGGVVDIPHVKERALPPKNSIMVLQDGSADGQKSKIKSHRPCPTEKNKARGVLGPPRTCEKGGRQPKGPALHKKVT